MALNRKYAALPDLDSAPDIYETPELTDDNSTVPTTAPRSQSGDEFYDPEEADADDDAGQNISRSRLQINEARQRFHPTTVDAGMVDFSDRVDGKRKSYKTSNRRQRVLEDGTEEFGSFSDEEEDENLDRKIARLRRELEEAKAALSKPQSAPPSSNSTRVDRSKALESLSELLEDISKPVDIEYHASTGKTPERPISSRTGGVEMASSDVTSATYTVMYAPAYEQSHALAKAASFDRRLSQLEMDLGIGSSAVTQTGGNGFPRAMLSTLDSMEKSISALAHASTSNLDAISRRVRSLASEQEKLNESREKTKALREELGQQGSPSMKEDSDQETKINALYGILPSIESMTPMLPPLLDRLRSLRTIHAGAATAAQTLGNIEQQQADTTKELQQWRAGLEKLEEAMRTRDSVVEGNLHVMDGWVKDLEGRIAKFEL